MKLLVERIQSTNEKENNTKFFFLDVLFFSENHFHTTVHCKPFAVPLNLKFLLQIELIII